MSGMPGSYDPSGYTIQDGLDSVGMGWHSLVKEAFDAVPKGWQITQVKEKFGRLRIYADPDGVMLGTPNEFQETLNNLESRSGKICEICGKDGVLIQGGWWKTACEDHA